MKGSLPDLAPAPPGSGFKVAQYNGWSTMAGWDSLIQAKAIFR
jgi:hypothetical protein